MFCARKVCEVACCRLKLLQTGSDFKLGSLVNCTNSWLTSLPKMARPFMASVRATQMLDSSRLIDRQLGLRRILVKRKCQYWDKKSADYRKRTTLMYVTAGGVLVVGFSYAAVPMYRIYCQSTGYGGEVAREASGEKVENMKKVKNRKIKIRFNADTSSSLQWKFKPQQSEIVVMPGETALAFYTATNPTDRQVIGISTYNVIPFESGKYFNKIQCFCFEEQCLNPHEQVDMPVFFYIDPEFADDPMMETIHEITLSYTFFEAREGLKLPVPSYARF